MYGLNTKPALPGTLEAFFTTLGAAGLGGVTFLTTGLVIFLGVVFTLLEVDLTFFLAVLVVLLTFFFVAVFTAFLVGVFTDAAFFFTAVAVAGF